MNRVRRYMMLILMALCWIRLSAQHCQIGDVYTFPDSSEGVVFYLLPDGTGGWAVSLHDANVNGTENFAWGTNSNTPGIPHLNINTQLALLLSDTAGYSHTQTLLDVQGSDNIYASGTVDSGWYLPSAMQLRVLHGQWPLIRNALLDAGGANLSNAYYWSSSPSSQNSNKQAYKVYFFSGNDQGTGSGFITSDNKTNQNKVRAVRNFSYPEYQWSTGSTASEITVNPSQTSTYYVTVTNTNGCESIDSCRIVVSVHDTTFCADTVCDYYVWHGDTLRQSDVYTTTLSDSWGCDSVVVLNLTVNYTKADTLFLSVLENELPVHLNDSIYYVDSVYHQTLTNAAGCDSLLTIDLEVIYNVSTRFDTTICADMLPFDWDSDHHFESADTLRDTLSTTLGADSILLWVLHVMPLPTPTHTPDTTKGTCLPITLWAANADSLIWKDAFGQQLSVEETLTVNPDFSTCYYLTAKDLHTVGIASSITCHVTDTICVEVLPPDTTMVPVSACNYYLWYGDSLTAAGVYPHTLTDVLGCDSVVMLHLSLIDTALQVVSLTENFCTEMSAELSVITELTNYLWSTGETSPQITVTQPGTYTVTASQGDCQNSGYIVVDECHPQLFLPNSITPSRSDGINDVFSIPELQQNYIYDFEIRIFNRFGEQIFYSTDKHFQWNGECKGAVSYNTVFTYVIHYSDAKGKVFVKRGSITVL